MTIDAHTDVSTRPLRADAERNRLLLLEVAAQVFAEKGLDAGFDEIARRAGVGVGTVYRRFPHRDQLVEALLRQRLGDVTDLAVAAIDSPDAWAGFVGFLETSIEMLMRDHGLRNLLDVNGRWAECLMELKSKLFPAIAALIDRAQRQGRLRADIGSTDIDMLIAMISTVHDPRQPALWRRYLTLLIDGLRTERNEPTPLPVHAPQERVHHTSGNVSERASANVHRVRLSGSSAIGVGQGETGPGAQVTT